MKMSGRTRRAEPNTARLRLSHVDPVDILKKYALTPIYGRKYRAQHLG